jgi:hypothetical protein
MTPTWFDLAKAIHYLVKGKYPGAFGPGGRRVDREAQLGAEAYRAELNKMSASEIQALYEAQLENERKLAEQQAELAESQRSYNLPWAKRPDYAYWGKVDFWTLDEGIALILERDPKHAKWSVIEPYTQVSPFAREFERVRLLALRTAALGQPQLGQSNLSAYFLSWAKRKELAVPTALEAEVAKHAGDIVDWHQRYIELSRMFDEYRDEALANADKLVDAAKTGIEDAAVQVRALIDERNAEWKAAIHELTQERDAARRQLAEALATGAAPGAKERESLLKLVIGMAIVGYKYDPAKQRNAAISEIAGDLQTLGVSLDEDTVRKWLREGAGLLPPAEKS